MSRSKRTAVNVEPVGLDPVLLAIVCLLLGGGLVLLTSASISLAERNTGNPLFYFERQFFAAVLGIAIGAGVLRVPSDFWERLGLMLPCLALVMLLAVLVPGLGYTVNGSTRWFRLAGVTVQVAEPARLLMLMYLAGYAVRHARELQAGMIGLIKPMVLVAVCCALLLAQPDFGSAVVLAAVSMAVLFVGGSRLRDLLVIVGVFVILGVALAVVSPYRMARITGFMDPWADPYGKGYQLSHALIAFGRGEWFGVGLGASVEKLFYLPEAHTDFLLAVIAEELGFAGVLTLLLLFAWIVWRAFAIGRRASDLERPYAALVAQGIGLWIGVQVIINMGVNMGVLPTKGLTLPLLSFGGSAILATCCALAVLLRIDWENKQLMRGFTV